MPLTRVSTALAAGAALFLVAPALVAPAPAAAQALTPAQEDAVRALVRDTLVNDPDILREAFAALQAQEESLAAARQAEALKAHAKALTADPTDPVMGNPKGDVTIVEFSDYRCSYCKSVMDTVLEVVAADGNVRFIVKEFPILGPDSLLAARYALAAHAQGKYEPYHQALMRHRGTYTEEGLKAIARELGLDADRLARDAQSAAVQQKLIANRSLGEELGIRGTPAFIIGDLLMPGAVDAQTLKSAIADARAAAKRQ